MKHLLQIEALNIGRLVYDCHELSTIRGGSLLLVEAPKAGADAAAAKHPGVKMELLTSGASRAVYEMTCSESEAATLVSDIRAFFAADVRYKHTTIGVECVAVDDSLISALGNLALKLRWLQMRSASVSMAELSGGTGPCEVDLVRPVVARVDAAQRQNNSASVAARRNYGRTSKTSFLRSITNRPAAEFVDDLDGLTAWPAAGRLHDKMAVFAADGNAFGATLASALAACGGDQTAVKAAYQEFDSLMAGFRGDFLRALVDAGSGADWEADGKKRIELLLSGGDEVKVAVPAWQGLRVAEIFFRLAGALKFRGASLKFGAGLVFCHKKAPIHAVVNLAGQLQEEAKKDRTQNRLSYLVLESFDHVGDDLEGFRRRQLPERELHDGLSLDGGSLADLALALKAMNSGEFPRRKLYQALGALRESESAVRLGAANTWVEKAEKSLEPELKPHYDIASSIVSPKLAAWFHMAELWDYVEFF